MFEIIASTVVGGVVSGAVTWWITARYYRKALRRADKKERDERIGKVVERYARDTIIATGFHGLIRADIASLASDEEIREVFDSLERRGSKRPLGKYERLFDGVDMLRFFRWAASEGVDFHRVSPEQAIERFKNAPSD